MAAEEWKFGAGNAVMEQASRAAALADRQIPQELAKSRNCAHEMIDSLKNRQDLRGFEALMVVEFQGRLTQRTKGNRPGSVALS